MLEIPPQTIKVMSIGFHGNHLQYIHLNQFQKAKGSQIRKLKSLLSFPNLESMRHHPILYFLPHNEGAHIREKRGRTENIFMQSSCALVCTIWNHTKWFQMVHTNAEWWVGNSNWDAEIVPGLLDCRWSWWDAWALPNKNRHCTEMPPGPWEDWARNQGTDSEVFSFSGN